ncbi:hypothetical protein QF019_000935 [Pseudomonas frederiksbergensis]|uniref:hypothetical protein n=1 Tax=Pseudomonas frederiksbergensis TaxID=104087 RepID=UPI003D1A4391
MSKFQKLTPAQKIRQNYHLMLLNNPKAADPPPRMHDDNPLLPTTPADNTNQLPARFRGLPLKVWIDGFAESSSPPEYVSLQLVWNGTLVGDPIVTMTPIDPDDFPLQLVLPGELTEVQGMHELMASIDYGGNPEDTEALMINIDTTPPIPNGAVVLPDEIDRDGITKKYLDDNGSVRVVIPAYASRIGDVIEVYYGDSLPSGIRFGRFERIDNVTPISFELTADTIGTAEGKHHIFYYLSDRAGNRSGHSQFKDVEVTLTDPPQGLLPPDIPLAVDDIDLADAYMGVGVGILGEYTNYMAGDQLVVTWDGQLQTPATIPGFPFYVTLPYSVIHNGNEGPKTVVVSYQILRAGKYYPMPPAPAPFRDDVDVDVRKPGPDQPDPDNPDPVNPNLLPVVVRGGGPAPENDKIQVTDVNFPATATRLIYGNFKVGDFVQLYWKNVAVPEDTSARGQGGVWRVQAGDDATTVMGFSIPWTIIDAGGNLDALPVHYTVGHSINDNVDTSLPKNVEVFIRQGVVPDPRFLHLHATIPNRIVCSSLRLDSLLGAVIEVAVAGGEPQLADQELTFTYQGYSEETGTNLIPGNTVDVKYTPTTQEATAGFIVKIPYEQFRVTRSAWGDVTYKAIIDGFETASSRHLVRVHMVLGSGNTCDIPTT